MEAIGAEKRQLLTKGRDVPGTLERLLGALPQTAGLLLDERGMILACGPTLPDFLPPSGELLHTSVAQIPPPALGRCVAELWSECRRSGAPVQAETVFCLDPTARAGPISASLRAAPHPESEAACVVTVRDAGRDGARVQVLLDHIDALERRVKRCEAVLQTTRHDTLSSLSALKGFLDLTLSQAGVSPACVQNLSLAREIADQIGAIAERSQSVAEASLPRAEVALLAVGHRLLRALRAAHPEVPFTWTVRAPDLRLPLPADVLWDVLWNLLSNSVKYRSPARPLHVDLHAGCERDEVWVEVRDNGRGIPPGDRETIFEQGRRGSNTRGVPGNGVGLFSAGRLLRQYGGRIQVTPCLEGAAVRLSFGGWVAASPPR